MAASHLPGEPEDIVVGGGDAFLDALAGLDSVCRTLAIALGEAARPGAEPGGARGDGAAEEQREPPEEIIDALLGLVSVHRTVSLLLAAMGAEGTELGDGADAGPLAPEEPPAWSREVLR